MTAGARVGAFGALLVAIFALAALAGRTLDPSPASAGGRASHAAEHAHEHEQDAVALRLVAAPATLPVGRGRRLRLRVVAPGGATVRSFDVEQARRLHLIVVPRDLAGVEHPHPTQRAEGSWDHRLFLQLRDRGVVRTAAFTHAVAG